MNVPKNVWWFEVLLYASLLLDALSVAFLQDRTPTPRMTEQMIDATAWTAFALLVLLFWFVWLAARRRKSWPRWALSTALVLSLISLAHVIGERGMQFDVFVDTVSCGMTALGLYLSFTGDAKDWFDA